MGAFLVVTKTGKCSWYQRWGRRRRLGMLNSRQRNRSSVSPKNRPTPNVPWRSSGCTNAQHRSKTLLSGSNTWLLSSRSPGSFLPLAGTPAWRSWGEFTLGRPCVWHDFELTRATRGQSSMVPAALEREKGVPKWSLGHKEAAHPPENACTSPGRGKGRRVAQAYTDTVV